MGARKVLHTVDQTQIGLAINERIRWVSLYVQRSRGHLLFGSSATTTFPRSQRRPKVHIPVVSPLVLVVHYTPSSRSRCEQCLVSGTPDSALAACSAHVVLVID
jgi:uncharacterized NAD(P)/FAD-binding protein YdhS